MTTNSSKPTGFATCRRRRAPRRGAAYSRFIPREELAAFAAWSPGQPERRRRAARRRPTRTAPAAAAGAGRFGRPRRRWWPRRARPATRTATATAWSRSTASSRAFATQMTAQLGAAAAQLRHAARRAASSRWRRPWRRPRLLLARRSCAAELTTQPEHVAAVAQEAVERRAAERAPHPRARAPRRPCAGRRRAPAEALAARGARLLSRRRHRRAAAASIESDIGADRRDASTARWQQRRGRRSAASCRGPTTTRARPPTHEPDADAAPQRADTRRAHWQRYLADLQDYAGDAAAARDSRARWCASPAWCSRPPACACRWARCARCACRRPARRARRGGGLHRRPRLPDAHRRRARPGQRRAASCRARRRMRRRARRREPPVAAQRGPRRCTCRSATACSAAWSTRTASRWTAWARCAACAPSRWCAAPINAMDRDPVRQPLDTGVRAINALLTVGRGQRIGLFAGTGVGKTRAAGHDGALHRGRRDRRRPDRRARPRGQGVHRGHPRATRACARSVVVAAPADAPPLVRMQGANYATAIAEHFRDQRPARAAADGLA